MESYAVRITHPKTTVQHIIASWSTQCEKLLAYEHTDASKIHCHLLIVNSRIGKKQLRNIAANCGVNVKGNESMSFKAYDSNNRYLTYMSKGQFNPFYLQGYTQDECDAAKAEWVPNQKKQNPQIALYNRFEATLDLQSESYRNYIIAGLQLNPKGIENLRFEFIRSRASAYSFAECDRIANYKYVNMYKMLVNTYCMRHNIPVERNWKGNFG